MEFEKFLSDLVAKLADEANKKPFIKPLEFEQRIRELINDGGGFDGCLVDLKPHPHIFPDINLGKYGIEVKFSTNDTWRSVANSVLESTRDEAVEHIYVVFGKMGGEPGVKWGKYEDCVMHVRTSHVPRFELEMTSEQSLFDKIGVSYADFHTLSIHEKMVHIRAYARSRMKPGDRLWWLEDSENAESHTLPLEVRLYMNLTQTEKRRLRAEGALLCPQIVQSSRTRNKYNDVVMYFLTYHGVLCPQARDLFSAGSVAMRSDQTRGGNYVHRALLDIEEEMLAAARELEDALFVEYWGKSCPPENRVQEWLRRADDLASDWIPSDELFKTHLQQPD